MAEEITGLAELRARLEAIKSRMGAGGGADMQPALLRAGIAVLKSAADRIDAGGPGWPPNKSGTPLLHRTGALLRSLTVGGPYNIDRGDASSITVGTNIKYGRWLQEGTRAHDVHAKGKALAIPTPGGGVIFRKSAHIGPIPPRPFLYVDEQAAETVGQILATWVMQGA